MHRIFCIDSNSNNWLFTRVKLTASLKYSVQCTYHIDKWICLVRILSLWWISLILRLLFHFAYNFLLLYISIFLEIIIIVGRCNLKQKIVRGWERVLYILHWNYLHKTWIFETILLHREKMNNEQLSRYSICITIVIIIMFKNRLVLRLFGCSCLPMQSIPFVIQ